MPEIFLIVAGAFTVFVFILLLILLASSGKRRPASGIKLSGRSAGLPTTVAQTNAARAAEDSRMQRERAATAWRNHPHNPMNPSSRLHPANPLNPNNPANPNSMLNPNNPMNRMRRH